MSDRTVRGANLLWRKASRAWAWIACLLLLVGSATVAMRPAPARAVDETGFGDKINLSEMEGRSVRPALAAVDDNVYVAWQDNMNLPGGPHMLFRRSTDKGVSFEPTIQLDAGPGISYFPAIAAAGSHVYVTWGHRPIDRLDWDILLASSSDFGQTFSTPINLSNTTRARYAAIVGASDTYVYVLWGESKFIQAYGAEQTVLMISASSDQGANFSDPVQLNDGLLADQVVGFGGAAVSGADAYVVWMEREKDAAGHYTDEADILMTRLTAGAVTGGPVNVSQSPGSDSSTPTVAAVGDRVFVAWAEDAPQGEILLRTSTDRGATLDSPRNLSQNPGGSIYPLLKASGNNVYLNWLDGSNGGVDIYFTRSIDAGETFPAAIDLTYGFSLTGGTWAWFPSMGVSGNNLYIAWADPISLYLFSSQDAGQNLLDGGGGILPFIMTMVVPGSENVFRPTVRAAGTNAYLAWDAGETETLDGWISEFDVAGKNREVFFRAKPGLDPDLILDHAGAVQVIYDPAKLVAGKKTLVQAEITNGFDHQVTTKVQLTYDLGTGSETTLTQDVTLEPGTTTVNLPEEDFLLPTGTTFLARVVVDPDNQVGETHEDNNIQGFVRPVAATRPFRVMFLPIQVGDDPAVGCTTLQQQQARASAFLRAVLPVSEDGFHEFPPNCTPFHWEAESGLRLTGDEFVAMVKALDELAAQVGADKVVGVLRPGWFHDIAPEDYANVAGIALGTKGEGGAYWDVGLVDGNAEFDQVSAHELFHTYTWVDEQDPLFLPPPANHGHMGYQLSPGYWVDQRLPKNNAVDLMYPNQVQNPWVSRSTYEHLFNLFKYNPADPPVINVAGTITKDGHATLDPWYRFDSTLDRDLGASGAYTIVYLDANGATLGSTGFDVQFDDPVYDGGPATIDAAPFSVRIPDVAGTARLELRQGNQLLAARDVSAHAPQVHLTSPNGGEIAAPGQTLNITWDASDADGDTLTYAVALSRDGGQTWLPVAHDLTVTQSSVMLTTLDITTQALVRVTATDGINTTTDTSDALFTIRQGVGSELTLGPAVNVSNTNVASPAGAMPLYGVSVADGGNLYVAWNDYTPSGRAIEFRRSTDGGDSFGGLTEVGKAITPAPNTAPALAAANGKVYLAWPGYVPPQSYTQPHMLFRRSLDGGATFAPVQELELVADRGSDARLAASGDNVYVLWRDQFTNDLVLRASHDAGATFESKLVIGNTGNGQRQSARLAASGSDVFVVWSSDTTGTPSVYFRRSADAGVTFTDPVPLVSNDPYRLSAASAPQLTLADGRLYVAWQETRAGIFGPVYHLYVRTSADDGATFGDPVELRPQWHNSADLDYGTPKDFSLTASGADVYVSWQSGPVSMYGGGDPDNGKELILLNASHDHGVSFSPPVRILAIDDAYYLNTNPPALGAFGNNVFVAWNEIHLSGSTSDAIRVRGSTDGGGTFDDPITVATAGPGSNWYLLLNGSLQTADAGHIFFVAGNPVTPGDIELYLRSLHASASTNQPPEVSAGDDQTTTAGATVALSGSAVDPDGDPLIVTWRQTSGPDVSLGTTSGLALSFRAPEVDEPTELTFELKAYDGLVAGVDTVTVMVNPRAPITDFAAADPDLWNAIISQAFPPPLPQPTTTGDTTPPVVTGTADRAPDANGWYNHSVTITWTGQDDSGGPVSCDPPTVYSGPDATSIELEGSCTDAAGNVGTGSLTIKYDGTAPSASVTASPGTLWPPDHKLVDVTVSVSLDDQSGLSGPGGFSLVSVTSNEPDEGLGDGDTPDDIQGWTVGTADTAGRLRAERSGTGTGRVYTLTYEVRDQAGNTATVTTTVAVPRDQRSNP